MKLLHLSDLHLGRSLSGFDLVDDQKYILNQILEMAVAKSVDVVLIAGDVFDKAIPSEAATKLLDYFLDQLAYSGINVFMISGNHDSDERLNYGSSFFERRHVYISAIFDGTLHSYTLKDEYGEVDFYLLPFVKASQVRHFFPDETIESYEDAIRTIIEHTHIDQKRRNIMIAHQFVSGRNEDPQLSGSESASVQNVGLIEKIGYDCFDQFDYVALGHIHSPQRVGREEVRYSGSPLKYSLSEANNMKSVPIITLGKKEKTEIELAALRPMRDMRHIRGKLKELLERENVKNSEDFIYVTLTDEEIVNDVMGIFQQAYPNTIKIDYDNSHTREIEQVDISRIANNRSFSELVQDFYQQMYGCQISEEEMEVMRMAASEAGVIDEAN